MREEISVAKEHHRLSCLWRHGWRPWRMAVEARRRSLRKCIKHRYCSVLCPMYLFQMALNNCLFVFRQCKRMRSTLAALALHALKSRMEAILAELTGTVALHKRLVQGRQKRAFNVWLQLASAMHWRRGRMQTLCWLAWQAQTVATRRSLRKSKQHFHGGLRRRGMRAWKAAYSQVGTLLCTLVHDAAVSVFRVTTEKLK